MLDGKPESGLGFLLSESERRGRAYSRPFFDVCLFAQKAVHFSLQCFNACSSPLGVRQNAQSAGLEVR